MFFRDASVYLDNNHSHGEGRYTVLIGGYALKNWALSRNPPYVLTYISDKDQSKQYNAEEPRAAFHPGGLSFSEALRGHREHREQVYAAT
jgi:hypothetical protein